MQHDEQNKIDEVDARIVTPEQVTGKRKVLPNGKVEFFEGKVFHGEKPEQPYNLGW